MYLILIRSGNTEDHSGMHGRIAVIMEAAHPCPMRIVEKQNRSEIELDPIKAYRRGRGLDDTLRSIAPPIKRSLMRSTHEYVNRLDEERQTQTARALNTI